MFLLSMVQFYPGRPYYHPCRFKTCELMQLRQLYRANIYESNNKMFLVNISHSSCTSNNDHVGLSIKTGSIQKERTMTQTTIRNF